MEELFGQKNVKLAFTKKSLHISILVQTAVGSIFVFSMISYGLLVDMTLIICFPLSLLQNKLLLCCMVLLYGWLVGWLVMWVAVGWLSG